ncbi:hypothetical protein CASFOL_027400 [Castilleja foliolosa]|uniref:Uncharacterized protein n=1 Tax=Castilleja foliolosa TaxID=1961234 RepID=A0ABD3CGE4_9LAMI
MGCWGKANKFCNIFHRIGNLLKKKRNSEKKIDHGLSAGEIKRRMVGIPVYKLSTYSEDDAFVISDHDDRKTVSFYFISKPDALDFFDTTKLHYDLGKDWRIFDTPLSDVYILLIRKGKGFRVLARLVPESSQIKNAIEEKKDMSASDDNIFTGVPVFKPSKLRLHATKTGEKFCPAYLRKIFSPRLRSARDSTEQQRREAEGGAALRSNGFGAVVHVSRVAKL